MLVVITESALRLYSEVFADYEKDPDSLTLGELAQARDYAKIRAYRFCDLAWTIADRLGNTPTWYHVTTDETYRRCQAAYERWIAGEAEPADMLGAQNYCMMESDYWEEEVQMLNKLIEQRCTHEQS